MSSAYEIDGDNIAAVIVGLGNPGEQYRRNRHNAGFMAVDALARQATGRWSTYPLSLVCRVELNGYPVLLVKPVTYMNRSGEAVHMLMAAIHRKPEDLLLVYDDLDLPFGRIRIRPKGSSGGHRGVESVLAIFETEEIMRVRMGIGQQRTPDDAINFVLSDFLPEQQSELDEMILKTGNAVKSILSDGVSKSMTIYNA